MLDKLWELLQHIWESINPFFIIPEYAQGLLLRFGKYKKVCEPGIHIKIPFVDELIQQHTVVTTISLSAQSLYTMDKVNIVVRGMVKYRISDIKVFLLEVFDAVDAVSDISQGIIKQVVMSKTSEECMDNELDNTITKKCRAEIKKMGVEVIQVTLTDIAPIRSYRLINDTFSNKLD